MPIRRYRSNRRSGRRSKPSLRRSKARRYGRATYRRGSVARRFVRRTNRFPKSNRRRIIKSSRSRRPLRRLKQRRRAFQAKVDMALRPQHITTDETRVLVTWAPARHGFRVHSVGENLDYGILWERASANNLQYQLGTPGTTGQKNQYRCQVTSISTKMAIANFNTARIFVTHTVWAPRHDKSDTSNSFSTLYEDSSTVLEDGSNKMEVSDYRWNAFMNPNITSNYKCMKSRKFILRPGQTKNMILRQPGFSFSKQEVGPTNATSSNPQRAFKNAVRYHLFEVHGDIGVVKIEDQPIIRNMEGECAFLETTTFKYHMKSDNRLIRDDNRFTNDNAGISTFVNTKQAAIQTIAAAYS